MTLHAAGQLNPPATRTHVCTPRARAPQQEKPLRRKEARPPLGAAREGWRKNKPGTAKTQVSKKSF